MSTRPVQIHDPLPAEAIINLPYPTVVARAAELVGVAIGSLSLSLRLNAAPETLATTRAIAALLLAEIGAIASACPACVRGPHALDCASELGALEGRLQTVQDQARLALSLRLAHSAAA